MLKLINVCKGFKYGKDNLIVLDNINIDFKKNELVFILGRSGSGKSTLLNIIGGIISPDGGKVMLDDKDVCKFNDKQLSNYRNNMIGYIYQDYHLIEYMTVFDNIKLGQTIFNNSNEIDGILKKLGIYNKKNVVVNKLSGGQKQRVAIARAIINNPDIILCDEPTGALDFSNGVIIMEILKELAQNKLVIIVSHDQKLADKYADRIINIEDGKVDYVSQYDEGKFKPMVNKKISVFSIIKLAFKNLYLKLGRTLFTSLAISIGLVCMLLVLCLSKSFNNDINELEREIVSVFPVSIYNGEFEILNSINKSSDDKIIRKNKNDFIHENKINSNYLEYINSIDEISYVSYDYDISLPIISDRYRVLSNNYFRVLPSKNMIDNNYEILYGNKINSMNDILLKVDSNNNVSSEILDVFDIASDIDYNEIIGRKLRIVLNDDYYIKNGDYYYINGNNEVNYKNSNIELTVVGIVRENNIVDDNDYFFYNEDLMEYILNLNSKSRIVIDQLNNEGNILGIDISRDKLLSYLGYNTLPNIINIYFSNLDDKKIALDKLDNYNNTNNKMVYVDTMNDAIDILKNMINIISVVLLLFSLISIIISSFMIFILTSNRVMERIKEIGILRCLGARRKDIVKLFNTENLILGIVSSVIGVIVMVLLLNPINLLMEKLLDSENMLKIHIDLVIFCLLFNLFVVVISGYLPAKRASKKEIIDCVLNK